MSKVFNLKQLLSNTSINNTEDNTEPLKRTPDLIADEINDIKDKTRKLVLNNSIEIGRRLIEAKSLLEHGEWGEWLKKSVEYSQRTANNLMKIFEEYGSNQITFLSNNINSQALANLSYTQAVALLGIPSVEREEFIKENDVEVMSTRELQKVIKERNEVLNEYKEDEDISINNVKEKDTEIKAEIVEVQEVVQKANENIEVKIEPKPLVEALPPHPSIYKILNGMDIEELAGFICSRCNEIGRFCDFALECNKSKEEERQVICIRWLNMQAQKNC